MWPLITVCNHKTKTKLKLKLLLYTCISFPRFFPSPNSNFLTSMHRYICTSISARTISIVSAFHWNGLMRSQVANGAYSEALQTLSRMHRSAIHFDNFTFPIALKACTLYPNFSQALLLKQGQQIHGLLTCLGFHLDLYISNALVSMYSRFYCLKEALKVFDEMPQRSTVSWNSIIAGCVRNGLPYMSLSLFSRMLLISFEHPDSVTICTILNAFAHLEVAGLRGGQAVHGYVVRRGSQIVTISTIPFVENALINMYMESSSVISAEKVFNGMSVDRWDIVTWTTMISGYMKYKLHDLALETFRSLLQQQMNERFDPVTLAAVMPALKCLRMGKEMHCFAIKRGYDPSNVFVATSLLYMYGEFGTIEYAAKQFERLEERNVVAWTAMITAYAKHGRSEQALRLFNAMQKQAGVTPNHLTFMGVLIACAHAGLVDQARDCFTSMAQEYKLTPDMYHYAAMVDVLGRAGQVREAFEFIKAMPVESSAPVWGSLFASCGLHLEMELVQEVAKVVVGMEPANSGNFVHLANMFAQGRRWDDACAVREVMKSCGIRKVPGYSMVHVNQPTQ